MADLTDAGSTRTTAVPTLAMAGADAVERTRVRARDWLRRHQSSAGHWRSESSRGVSGAWGPSDIGVTALGADIAEAQTRAYEAVDAIDWPGGFCRRDIGWRAVKRGA